jgi:hypothetical protein
LVLINAAILILQTGYFRGGLRAAFYFGLPRCSETIKPQLNLVTGDPAKS